MDPKYPWLVFENLDDEEGEQIFYPIHDPLSQYQFRTPGGGSIHSCFHGWVILSNSNNLMWSIWNPLTCDVIHLPPLLLKDVDSESIEESCLSFPPDDPRSVLLLTIHEKPIIVFCRQDSTRPLGYWTWTQMSYAKQLKDMELRYDSLLDCLTCCNGGGVYALISGYDLVMHVDIDHVVVNDIEQVVINILPFVDLPCLFFDYCYSDLIPFLKGSCADDQLFYILLCFDEAALGAVYLYKLNITSLRWEEVQDLKDDIFLLDLANDEYSAFYRPEVASELGGYIHILGENGKAMHSLHIKDKTVSLSSRPSCNFMSSSRLSLWECTRLPSDHGEIKCRAYSKPVEGNGDIIMLDVHTTKNEENNESGEGDRDSIMLDHMINSTKNEENNESRLLNIPFDIWEKIMDLCVGVGYLNVRATCKTCQLGAPIIRWSKETTLSRLQTPWLVVVNHHQGLITFTDPIFGDNYFIKTPRELHGDMRILSSRYGWLLIMIAQPLVKDGNPRLVFFNPFTRDIREIPGMHVDMLCFSAPPTSPDCMVVGFGKCSKHVYVHFVAGEPYWRMLLVDANPHSVRFPTFHGSDLYALCKDGGLVTIKEIEAVQDYSWGRVTTEAPTSSCTQNFLVKGDQHFLLVKMSEFGEEIQVFKLNDSTKKWEKIDGLGRHVIYICDTTCIYMEAKTQETENKIYFPRLRSKNQKIVFYSLETCTFHTSDGKSKEQSFFGTQDHAYTHTWIQPSWS